MTKQPLTSLFSSAGAAVSSFGASTVSLFSTGALTSSAGAAVVDSTLIVDDMVLYVEISREGVVIYVVGDL